MINVGAIQSSFQLFIYREYNETSILGRKCSDGHSTEKSTRTTARRGASRDGRCCTCAYPAEGTTGNDSQATMALGVQPNRHAATGEWSPSVRIIVKISASMGKENNFPFHRIHASQRPHWRPSEKCGVECRRPAFLYLVLRRYNNGLVSHYLRVVPIRHVQLSFYRLHLRVL